MTPTTQKLEIHLEKAPILADLKNFTHVVRLYYQNHSGESKTACFLFNPLEPWFDHFYQGTDNVKVANGRKFGRMESLVASLKSIFKDDESIKTSKIDIYNLNDLSEPVMDFTKRNKNKDEQ